MYNEILPYGHNNYRKFDKISAKLHFNDMTDFKITACGNLSGAEN